MANMKTSIYIAGGALALLCAVFSGCTASSPEGAQTQDSRFVKPGGGSGYYILRPGSSLQGTLGLDGAPVVSTSNNLQAGRGRDVIAFRFDHNGVLSAPPAYIYQGQPALFYTTRLGGLVVGKSTLADIEGIFAGYSMTRENGGTLVYLSFRVRNPVERSP
jgi:hypothetical protein